MVALEQRITEVQQALDAVYNGSGQEHRNADLWLQGFQRTPEAWSVADALLTRNDAELQVTFFGAVTIHAKIRYDFAELPAETILPLRSSLINHLTEWSTARDVRPAVLTRLCLALAALALQTNWPNAVGDLTGALMSAGQQGQQQERAARVCLELLKVLPEECCNSHVVVSDAARDAFLGQLRASVPSLLGFLAGVAADSLGRDLMVQESVFKCLQSWLRYCDIPPDDLAAHPLFPAAFGALANPDLFETAVDFLVEVLRTYADPRRSMAVVAAAVPRAMALRPAFAAAVAEEDEDAARGYCRLFTEMGESYMELITDAQEYGQLLLVDLLLQCTAHPAPEIATIPFRFWNLLCRDLQALAAGAPGHGGFAAAAAAAAAEQEAAAAGAGAAEAAAAGAGTAAAASAPVVATFIPYLRQLVHVLIRLMRYPEDADQLTSDQIDDLKRHRYDVGDLLNDCAGVLGAVDCLRLLVPELEREVASLAALAADPQQQQQQQQAGGGASGGGGSGGGGGWQGVEAYLFGVRSLARGVPSDEGQAVPAVMTLLLQLPAQNAHVRYTANLVVGRYADWLRDHPEHLRQMFGFLLAGFGTPECAAAAATAIKNVCQACGAQMGEPVLDLYDQLLARREMLPFRDELEIVEGLSHVVSALPPDATARAVARMVMPVANALARLATAPDPAAGGGGAATGGAAAADGAATRGVAPAGGVAAAGSADTAAGDGGGASPGRGGASVAAASSSSRAAAASEERAAGREVDRLTCIVRHINPRLLPGGSQHPLLCPFCELWPVLAALLRRHERSDAFVEKYCRCVKHAMRTLGRQFTPLLEGLVRLVVEQFARALGSPLLYLSSIVVTDFGREPGYAAPLFEMLQRLSAAAAPCLESLDHLTAHPDVVEEYFYLVERVLSHCPEPLVVSPLLESVLMCGTEGLRLHHREARKGVLSCLETLVGLGLPGGGRHGGGGRDSGGSSGGGDGRAAVAMNGDDADGDSSVHRLRIEALLASRGAELVQGLVGCCVGDLPAYALDGPSGSVAGLMWKLTLLRPQWMQEWMAASLAQVNGSTVPPQQRGNFLRQLLEEAAADDRDAFVDTVRRFSHMARQNARRWNSG